MAGIALPRKRALAFGAIIAVGGALLLGASFVLSGIYNVAASAQHFDITDRLIKLTLWRSIDTYSAFVEVPALDAPGMAELGALHFATGCQPCHAAPGRPQNPIISGMYPTAPPLGEAVSDWDTEELYWIVRHGLKFTGMPQWPGERRGEEVWPVIAFLHELPDMTADDYAELTGLPEGGLSFGAHEAQSFDNCAGCHGDATRPPVSSLVPSLNGQNEGYLVRSLREYASDLRQSGYMEPLAAELSREEIERLAAEFSAMDPVPQDPPGRPVAEEQLAHGAAIAARGIPNRNVAACLDCHSGRSSQQFPRLEGLSPDYIAMQLRLFRSGVRDTSAYGAIMSTVAERLEDEDIAAVAAWFGTRQRTDRQDLSSGSGEARP